MRIVMTSADRPSSVLYVHKCIDDERKKISSDYENRQRLLYGREEMGRCLMHYRTKGSKNGVRRYQYEDGSLTPEGRIHYGVGDPRKKKTPDEPTGQDKKKTIQQKIADFNAKKKVKQDERKAAAKAENKTRLDEQKNIRNLTDSELQDRIKRLNAEKQYSELLNERANREKGEFRSTVSKLMKNAAEELAKKSISVVVDTIINKEKDKLASKNKIKLGDYKNVDLYSLDSDKLKAVSQAFQDAANIARNKYISEHQGRNPNDGNNNQNNNQQQGNNDNQNANPSNNGQPSKNQRKKIRGMANSGASVEDIASRMGVSESTVRSIIGGNEQQSENRNERSGNENSEQRSSSDTSGSNRERRESSESNSQQSNSSNSERHRRLQLPVSKQRKMASMAQRGMSAAEIARKLGVSESTVRRYAAEGLWDSYFSE